jgi:hypothetical protein
LTKLGLKTVFFSKKDPGIRTYTSMVVIQQQNSTIKKMMEISIDHRLAMEPQPLTMRRD